FDPIPQTDYYALCGYLRSSRYQQAFLDPPERFAEPLRRLTRLRAEADALAVAVTAGRLGRQLAGLADAVRGGRGEPPGGRGAGGGGRVPRLRGLRPGRVPQLVRHRHGLRRPPAVRARRPPRRSGAGAARRRAGLGGQFLPVRRATGGPALADVHPCDEARLV